MNPISLFIAAALFIAFIAVVNFVEAPSSDTTIFAAANVSGGAGSAGTTQEGGGGW